MRFNTLTEVCAAMHLSPTVSGEVGEQRGGLMFVAPPGHLKSTVVEIVEQFPRARIISNLTVQTLNAMRQDFISGEIQTLGFSDYEMIYKRHGSVSSQIEGTLMALADEGFRNPAFSDQRTHVVAARCTIIGAITIDCYEAKWPQWLNSGFARRFLWSKFSLKNSDKIEQSYVQWKKAELDGDFYPKIPRSGKIPHKLTESEAQKVLYQLRFQCDRKLPFLVAQRIISVLLWKFPDNGWKIWEDFSPSLGKDQGIVSI